LPQSFDRVLLAGLAKNPTERTESVEAFRVALGQAHARMFEPVRILVAEDDVDFREALEIKLHMEFPDAEVMCVPNGAEALRVTEHCPISVALLDLQMPELGAIPVTAALRAREDAADIPIPIVILTAAGGPSEWRVLHEIGADRFLVKPVDLDDVVALIRRMLRERILSAAQGGTPRLAARE
jgi:DNA-binding response OmpR family regulator